MATATLLPEGWRITYEHGRTQPLTVWHQDGERWYAACFCADPREVEACLHRELGGKSLDGPTLYTRLRLPRWGRGRSALA